MECDTCVTYTIFLAKLDNFLARLHESATGEVRR